MSSCLSGGSRTYAIDLEIVKSQSPSTTRTSQSSSPSSTVSESINSPLAISTRKPRTPRKRPNQTYNEAAALLSTIYPNIFSTKTLVKQPLNHTKVSEELSELLLINQQPIPEKPSFRILPKPANSSDSKPFQSPPIDYRFEEDFDAESILDEEMEEGIDSIMGNLSVNNDSYDHSIDSNHNWNGLGFGANFDFGFGVRAFRRVDDCDWWRFPTVDVLEISPKLNKASSEKKKKKKKVEKREDDDEEEQKKICSGSNIENSNSGLCLKLNYEEVLSAWSDRGSPFSEDFPGIDSSESDAIARLAEIDLFSENGGIREASVMRYREKRRNRLFSKKIRYEVRKVNADRRPRMKGRFVRRPNSAFGGQDTKRK